MLIPYQTQPPAARIPSATVLLMFANAIAYFVSVAMATHEASFKLLYTLFLQYGGGLHPLQWFTSPFLHMNLWQLLGDLFCLWVIGLVLESRLSTLKFVIIFFGIAILQAAMEQSLAYWLRGDVVGTAGAIYGLAAMILVWFPLGEVRCWLVWKRPRTIVLPVLFVVPGVLLIETLVGVLTIPDLSWWTPPLRMLGGVVGFVAASVALRYRWVDGRKQDIFSLASELREPPARQTPLTTQERERRDAQLLSQHADALAEVRELIAAGSAGVAFATHQRLNSAHRDWKLPESDFVRLIAAYHQQSQWAESIPAIVEYLQTFPQHSPRMRMQLATLLIDHARKPAQALHVLEKIPSESLSEYERRAVDRLRANAEALLDLDPYEIIDDTW